MAAAANNATDMYSAEKLSDLVYCIKENDTHLMYLVIGNDKAVLVDTGAGTGNLYDFIQKSSLLNKKQKILVINTHNHAEQTGANYQFSANGKMGKGHIVEDLCASGADKYYTRLLDSSFDWQVKPYKITRWLKDREVIKLGKNVELVVYYGPGHTPDSIYLHLPADNRIFIGDTFHQFDDVLFTYARSSIKKHVATVTAIIDLVQGLPDKSTTTFSASKYDTDTPCLPTLKNYQRFLFAIIAGVQKDIPLRVDEHLGSRFESRDKLMKVVLSRTIIAQLEQARNARADETSIQSSSGAESN